MSDKHSSNKIMWAVIIVAIVLIAIIYPLTVKQSTSAADAVSSGDDVEIRIQPVARIELAKAAAPASTGPKDATTIYNTVCGACHNTGAAGAPKLDDKAAWAPRVAQGAATLYKSALAGKNAMPPKGGAADLSDDEIKATVDYIMGKVK